MENLGIAIEFQGKTLYFDRTVANMNKAINTLKKEVRLFNKELKVDPKNIEVLTKKMNNLRQQEKLAKDMLAEYRNYLEDLNRRGASPFSEEWKQTVVNIEKAQDKVLGIEQQIAKLDAQMEDLPNAWDKFADVVDKVADGVGKVADKLEPISKASGDFLKGAVEGAVDFESAFADVEKTVTASDEQFDELRVGLRELAKEVPTSASELSKIAGLAGQMNVPAEQIVDFTKAMVDFGNATNISAEQATQEIAQIYNVIGKGGDFSDLDNLLSAIVELGNNSATTEKDIVEMFRNISAGATRVGMTEAEMVALASTLSSVGLDKGGASAISKIMTRIDMAVTQGGDDLKAWAEIAGLSAKEFQQAWGEGASDVLLDIVTAMSTMSDEGISMNKILSDLDISEIRQVDTISRLANANEEYAKNLGLANKAYKDGTALNEEAQKRYDTIASKIEIMKNNFMEFALTIGDMLLPYVDWLIQSVQALSDWLNNLSPHTKLLITRIATILAVSSPLMRVISRVLTGVGGLVRGIGMIGGVVKTLFSVVSAFWGFLAPMFGQLATFLATHAGWIGLIMILIGAVVELYNNCEPFREFVDNMIKKIKELWDKFKETNWIEVLGEKFGWFGEIIGGLIELVKTLLSWFGKLIDKALEFLGLKSSIEGFASGMSSHGNGLGKGINVIQSGGFNSGGSLTLNANFSVYSNNVTRDDVRAWSRWIADDINEELGRRI